MRTYAIKRLLISIPLVFAMTFVVFVIINWSGTSYFDTFENDAQVDPQIIELEKRRMGIYEPVPKRYFKWLQGVLFDVRFSPERRFLATFEDNDPARGDDKYKLGGSEILEDVPGPSGDYSLDGKQPAPLRSLADARGIASIFNPRDHEALVLTAGSAPAGLAVLVHPVVGAPIVFPMTAKDGKASVRIGVDEVLRKAAAENIRQVSVTSTEAGRVSLGARVIRRKVWVETHPGRHKRRTIQVSYAGSAGQYAELARLLSPHTNREISGFDWKVDWKQAEKLAEERHAAAVEKWKAEGSSGARPERAPLNAISFDRLEFEASVLDGEAVEVEVQLLVGPADAVRPSRLGRVKVGKDEETHALDLALAPADCDLSAVRGLRLVCDARALVEFDDFRLRAAGSAFGMGAPNFGTSMDKKKDVVSLIFDKVRVTILLNVFALIFTWLIALPAGVYGAVRQYSTGEKVLSLATFVGMAMPSFLLATLVVFLISLTYEIPKDSWWSWLHGILPVAGRTSADHESMGWFRGMADVAWHMIGPVTVGVLASIGGLQRVVRSTMLEEQKKLYVTAAMAKGLPPWLVIYKHTLRNAVIPFIASLGSLLPGLIGGSAFVEIVFEYPGIGKQMLESVQSRDIPVVMANTLIVGLLLVVGNLLADILLGLVDPRVSLEGA